MDDTDYAEYNPAPYAGGYDISLTYGHPLPPSDDTCYPLAANTSSTTSGSSSKTVGPASSPQESSSRESVPVSSAAGGILLECPPFDYSSMICEDGSWFPPAWWNKYWPDNGSCYKLPVHGDEEKSLDTESRGGEEVVQYGYIDLPVDDSFMGMDYLGASVCSFLGDGIMGNGGGCSSDGTVSVRKEPWQDTFDYLLGNSLSTDYYG